MLFIYFALNTIKNQRDHMIWSAHSEGGATEESLHNNTYSKIKAEKFNHLNPIAAILNMANICVCISIKLGR